MLSGVWKITWEFRNRVSENSEHALKEEGEGIQKGNQEERYIAHILLYAGPIYHISSCLPVFNLSIYLSPTEVKGLANRKKWREGQA